MIQFLQNGREKRTDNAVIVFEPVKVRAGAMWRLVKIARAALLIWGGVSLAGAAVAAIGYGRGGLEPYLQAAAETPASEPVAAVQPKRAPEPIAKPAAVRQVLPQSSEQPAIAAAVAPPRAAMPLPATADDAVVSAAREELPRQASGSEFGSSAISQERPAPMAHRLTPYDDAPDSIRASEGFDPLPEEGLGPLAAARLPRARPDEPLTTGSIDRHYEPQSLRRFRRLRDMPARYRNFDRYFPGMPRYREHRRLHPYFYNR